MNRPNIVHSTATQTLLLNRQDLLVFILLTLNIFGLYWNNFRLLSLRSAYAYAMFVAHVQDAKVFDF